MSCTFTCELDSSFWMTLMDVFCVMSVKHGHCKGSLFMSVEVEVVFKCKGGT